MEIAGQIFNHRLEGYFYYGVPENIMKTIPDELRSALQYLIMAQKDRFIKIVNEIQPVLQKLEHSNVKFAGLKGIVFNADFNNAGARRSNDLDLLVHEDSLNELVLLAKLICSGLDKIICRKKSCHNCLAIKLQV